MGDFYWEYRKEVEEDKVDYACPHCQGRVLMNIRTPFYCCPYCGIPIYKRQTTSTEKTAILLKAMQKKNIGYSDLAKILTPKGATPREKMQQIEDTIHLKKFLIFPEFKKLLDYLDLTMADFCYAKTKKEIDDLEEIEKHAEDIQIITESLIEEINEVDPFDRGLHEERRYLLNKILENTEEILRLREELEDYE